MIRKRVLVKVFIFVCSILGLLAFISPGFPEKTVIVSEEFKSFEVIDYTPIKATNPKWVDSVFNTLSARERIAQLFMVAAYSNKNQKHVDEILKLVSEYKIGGLIFFPKLWGQGSNLRQRD